MHKHARVWALFTCAKADELGIPPLDKDIIRVFYAQGVLTLQLGLQCFDRSE